MCWGAIGIFIVPQHFQQQEKYLESRLDDYVINHNPFFYGVHEIEFDESLFKQGVVRLSRLSAILDDGTTIEVMGEQSHRLRIKLPHGTQESKLYVVIQAKNSGVNEVSFDKDNEDARYHGFDKQVGDLTDIR